MNRKRKLLNVLFIINCFFLLALAISGFAGTLDPDTWWPVSLTGLFFIVLLIIAILSGIFWLFLKPRYAIFCLLAILTSIPNIIITFPLRFTSGLDKIHDPSQLRIVTWNVGLLNYSARDNETAIRQNEKIFSTLRDLNADVLCLQEFFTAVIPDPTYNFIDSFKNEMGYHYNYFSRDNPKFDGKFYGGTIILSRHPITDSSRKSFPGSIARSVIKTGILFRGDTINVVSTQLQNLNIGRDTEIPGGASGGSIHKLKYGYESQQQQVAAIQQLILNNNRPLILTGDINNVPSSYTYRHMRGTLNDAWLEKGAGIGSTYSLFAHILRIDHIFYNDSFKAAGCERIKTDASDHYGIVADLQLIK